MKSSSKFLAIIALFFTFTFAANAQQGGGKSLDPEKMAENETSRMVEKLNLDNDQIAKAEVLNFTYAKKIVEARENNKENRDAMREIGEAINSEKNAEMKLLLTEAQYKNYEQMQAEKGKGKRGEKKVEFKSSRHFF